MSSLCSEKCFVYGGIFPLNIKDLKEELQQTDDDKVCFQSVLTLCGSVLTYRAFSIFLQLCES